MATCHMCTEQAKKSRNGKPHQYLKKTEDVRIFKGAMSRGYSEQDYQCLVCHARFTHSSSKNDLTWTLWQG